MDNALAAEPNSNAFLQYLQQQQQQQQHYQNQQQQPEKKQQQQQQQQQQQHHQQQQRYDHNQQQHHYQYHQHISASSFQPLPLPASSASAPGLPFHQNPTPTASQQGSANPTGSQNSRTLIAQHGLYQMPAPMAGAVHTPVPTQILPLGVYNGAQAHPGGAGPSVPYYSQHQASFYGWGGMDMQGQGSQWPQQSWDNCLPPGVDPPTTTVPPTTTLPPPTTLPHPRTSLPHPQTTLPHPQTSHPHPQTLHHPYPYARLHQVFTTNPWTTRPAHMFLPRKRKARADEKTFIMRAKADEKTFIMRAKADEKTSIITKAKSEEKKIPPFKTTITKETGPSEGGVGWCAVCQRDCVTEMALKQHLDGKKHKKQVERQRVVVEEASAKKVAMEGGGGVEEAAAIQQMFMQVARMESRGKPPKKKTKSERRGRRSTVTVATVPSNAAQPLATAAAGANATPLDVNVKSSGGDTVRPEVAAVIATPVEVANATPLDANVKSSGGDTVPPEVSAVIAAPLDVNVIPCDGDEAVPEADGYATGAVADQAALSIDLDTTTSTGTKTRCESGLEKEEVWFRCELCNVGCNTQAVLELHFGGRKHLNKLKKIQELPAGEQTYRSDAK